MIWSILIPSIPERYASAQPLLYSLLEQQSVFRMPDVELLYLMNNRRRSVGEKRNALMDIARGEYVSFIDDDDEVHPEYIQRIYRQLVSTRRDEDPADVVCFPQKAILPDYGVTHACTYSLEYWREREPSARRRTEKSDKPDVLLWTGPPAHTMVWRRDIVKDARFPDKNFQEDSEWVDKVCEKATTEIQMGGEALYIYRFSEEGTATR